jgi:hypothetical protein
MTFPQIGVGPKVLQFLYLNPQDDIKIGFPPGIYKRGNVDKSGVNAFRIPFPVHY